MKSFTDALAMKALNKVWNTSGLVRFDQFNRLRLTTEGKAIADAIIDSFQTEYSTPVVTEVFDFNGARFMALMGCDPAFDAAEEDGFVLGSTAVKMLEVFLERN